MSTSLARGLESVVERIDRACHRAGRERETVRLVAISKTFPAETVREAMALGQTLFGENRVQEALGKIPDVGEGAAWHLVGHLQRNKARHCVGVFELIHGVDDARLAVELDRRSAAAGVRQAILVQVNLSGEETKAGVPASDLIALLDEIEPLQHVALEGLMTIPPPVERPEQSRAWFARLTELRDEAARHLGRPLPELSMGMTGDFEVAVEEGATLVRVGRAIFGERPNPPPGVSR